MHIEIVDGVKVVIDGQYAGVLADVLINHPQVTNELWAAARLELGQIPTLQRSLAVKTEQIVLLNSALASAKEKSATLNQQIADMNAVLEQPTKELTEEEIIAAEVSSKVASHHQEKLEAARALIVDAKVKAELEKP